MPFASRRQQRFAFATRQPWAKRWAKETPSFAALPEKKDAGAPLHGPGGLLSTPGMGGRLRKRLKATRITGNLYRGDTGQFQAGGASTPSSAAPTRKPPAASSTTARRRKPARTEQERTDERQGKQRERDDARAAQRTENRANVLRSLNIAPDGAEALDALRRGEQPDAAAIARAGFVDAGLVEQSPDGSYRMTPTGRAVLSAADAGDRGRAGDTISGGRDRVMTRRQRQQAAAERKKPKAPPASAGGGGKEKPKIDVAGRMARINARLARMRKRRGLPVPKPTRQTTKAQTAQDRAIFAKMGGGKGGGGGGGAAAGGGKLWAVNPDTGKRTPPKGAAQDALQRVKKREVELQEKLHKANRLGAEADTAQRNGDRARAARLRDEAKQLRADAHAPAAHKRDMSDLSAIERAGYPTTTDGKRLIPNKNSTTPKMKAQTAQDRAMFAKMGGGGKGGGGGGSAGGGGALWSKGPDGKRAPTDKQRDTQQQRQIRQLAVSDKKRDTYARQAGDKAETETRKRYRVDSRGNGEYSLSDQSRSTSSHRGVSVASGDKDKVERALATKIRTARTRAENDARQEVNFYNSDVRGGMYSTPSSAKRDRDKFKSFTVYKSHDGTPRWLARTTTAYRDRDREIIAIKALDQDSQRMTAAGQFGPLRFWHLGRPDPLDPHAPWGPGLDVGDCDFSIQIGTTRVESGTFKSAQLAQCIAQTAAEYELSPGFFHPPNQPSADGVFTDIRTFERSLVPTKYGRASNLFTGLTVKGVRMEPDEMERRFKAAIAQLQLPPDQAAALSAGLIQADKSAQQQGIAYKSDRRVPDLHAGAVLHNADDAVQTITINGVTYKAEAPAYEAPPDVVINGVTYKAMPPFLADKIEGEEKADFGEGEEVGEEIGEADMGMDDAQLVAAIADAVVAKIAPMFGDMKMSELKAMLSGVATKDDSRAQEIAALKAAQTQLEQRIAQLSGDQPAAPLPTDVEAALKSTGPTTPNAAPTPANAVQSIAMQTLPQLYQADPSGAWAGWQPTVVPPSQS